MACSMSAAAAAEEQVVEREYARRSQTNVMKPSKADDEGRKVNMKGSCREEAENTMRHRAGLHAGVECDGLGGERGRRAAKGRAADVGGGREAGRGRARKTPTCPSFCRCVSRGGVLDRGAMLLVLVLFIAQPQVEATLNLPVQDSLLRNKQGGAVGRYEYVICYVM